MQLRDRCAFRQVICHTSKDSAEHDIVIGQRVLEPLDDHGAHTIASAVAIRPSIPNLTLARRGEEVAFA